MLTVETVEDAEAFRGLRGEWNELLESSASNCIFLTWEWLYTWWKHLSAGRRLSILVARNGEQLLGIAPLAIRPWTLTEWSPFPATEFLGVGTIGSDYLDVIVRPGSESAVSAALADYLLRRKLSLRLAQLRADAAVSRQIARVLEERNWKLGVRQTNVCPYIELSGHTWESYLNTLGPEHRYNVRRRMRRLASDCMLHFEQVENEADRAEAMRVLVVLHRRRWQARGGVSDALNTPEVLAFHEEWTRLALGLGWLRLFVLRLGDKPAAALYGLCYGKKFYFYQSGFDPACSSQSVGLVTLGLSIQRAIEEGVSEYDMLHGSEAYKFHWSRSARQLVRLDVDPPNVRGLLCRGVRGLNRASRRMARHVLNAMGTGRWSFLPDWAGAADRYRESGRL